MTRESEMKSLKICGLAAIAAMALLACLGVGSASATVLCTEDKNPCPAGKDEPAGTKIEASLNGSASWSTTAGTVLETCTKGTHIWEMQNTGGLNKNIVKVQQQYTWANCAKGVSVIALGTSEDKYIEGTSNAMMFDAGTEVTLQLFSADCVYSTGTGTFVGVAQAGTEAVLLEDVNLSKLSGSLLCPATIRFRSEWLVTSPKNLSWQPS